MRVVFLFITIFFFATANSQAIISSQTGIYQHTPVYLHHSQAQDSLATTNWFFSTYKGISTSISFFKGGNASIFSAPLGLQLNRRFTNNLYGFANVSVSPSYISFNPFFLNMGFKNRFGIDNGTQNSFGLYPAASLGLMYINDARTFSVSGSISAEKYDNPFLPYYPSNRIGRHPAF